MYTTEKHGLLSPTHILYEDYIPQKAIGMSIVRQPQRVRIL